MRLALVQLVCGGILCAVAGGFGTAVVVGNPWRSDSWTLVVMVIAILPGVFLFSRGAGTVHHALGLDGGGLGHAALDRGDAKDGSPLDPTRIAPDLRLFGAKVRPFGLAALIFGTVLAGGNLLGFVALLLLGVSQPPGLATSTTLGVLLGGILMWLGRRWLREARRTP